ncbi:hypothetical protein BASA81_004709 [Batrachochytrium salamandrivorans]|nr:hypothetical protein BASA81_004709 [Batrachochytrium salamandrivorans]
MLTPTQQHTLFVQRTVSTTERGFDVLQKTLEGCVRSNERICKKSLTLASVLSIMAESETQATSTMLESLSRIIKEREMARQGLNARLESLVIAPLKLYGPICTKLKADVKMRKVAMENERRKREQLDNAILKEGGDQSTRSKISQSQMELAGATQAVVGSTTALHTSVLTFEQRRREDLKSALSEIMWSEIQFHARSLELLTDAHNILHTANFEKDLEKIRIMLKD